MNDYNKKLDDYVHQVALRDFGRPFLHEAKFLPLKYAGNVAGRMNPGTRKKLKTAEERRKAPISLDFRARDFMDPKFVKTVRHELIHYFLYIDGKDYGHNRDFKDWSCKVDAGGTYHHRGLEYLYLRANCPSCGRHFRLTYTEKTAQSKCPYCKTITVQIEDFFNMNKIWTAQADKRRAEILKQPAFVVAFPDGKYLRGEKSYQPLAPAQNGRQLVQEISKPLDKRSLSLRQAYWSREQAEAEEVARRYQGNVQDRYQAWEDFIERPYLYQCKSCKAWQRYEQPSPKPAPSCKLCGAQELLFKGIR